MRSLECRIGLLNSHTHINRHAYVQKQRFVLCVFGSALSEAAGSPTVRLLLPPYVRRWGEDESAVLLRGCRARKQRVGRHRGEGRPLSFN